MKEDDNMKKTYMIPESEIVFVAQDLLQAPQLSGGGDDEGNGEAEAKGWMEEEDLPDMWE